MPKPHLDNLYETLDVGRYSLDMNVRDLLEIFYNRINQTPEIALKITSCTFIARSSAGCK